MDISYQGFVSGDLLKDVEPVKQLMNLDMEFYVAHSFSKTMTLYSDRVGAVHFYMSSAVSAAWIKGFIGNIIWTN